MDYVIENGLFCYGERYWYKKTTGEIVFFQGQIKASWPYWEDQDVYTWPPMIDNGYTPENTGVVILPYESVYIGKGVAVRVEDGKVIYEPYPEQPEEPQPEEPAE